MKAPRVYLRAGKEKSVLRFHPWIFSNAIGRMEGEFASGSSVEVFFHQRDWLAWGVYSPQSQIRIRLWSWERDEPISQTLIRNQLFKAFHLRETLGFFSESNCARLVHAESDGLPGLIVDRYGRYLVVQFLNWGVEIRRAWIVQELIALTGFSDVYERSDDEARRIEGLEDRKGVLSGAEPPKTIRILENGIKYEVDIRSGHKTGFYLDQKVNRLRIMGYAKDKEVLDCFSYSGGMTIPSIIGGAKK